jgi:hypothetical protein
MVIRVNVDERTITTDSNGKLKLKLSSDPNQGLSFDASGNLVATPGGSSGGGFSNISGNAIGPADATETTQLPIVGMNSTVSRHKKYTGDSAFIHNNDGVVMSKLSSGSLTNDCLAYYMINNNGGGQ